MEAEPTTETDAADNGDETGKVTEPETTKTTDETETDSKDEEDGSNVTPREKELRRLLRKNEKELDRLRKAEDERRKAELSESEKLREELEEKETKLSALVRAKVAAEHGLDAELAERLRGVTEEELSEDAERLATLTKPKPPKAKDVGLGGGSSKDEDPSDPRELHRKWSR